MAMNEYVIMYPEGYEGFAWEHEVKGWIGGILVFCDEKKYKLDFYSPERILQEIGDELENSAAFYEPNLVIIPEVNMQRIEAAVDHLVSTGRSVGWVSCPPNEACKESSIFSPD